MIGVSAELVLYLTDGFWLFFVVFLRVTALVSVAPAFGERSIPVRVKFGVATAFALIVAPAVNSVPPIVNPLAFGALAVTEIVVGLVMGIALRFFVLALQTAGTIAAQATSLSQILGGAAVEPVPAMGYFLVLAGLALAVLLGLHVRVAEFLIRSYDLFPVGTLPSAPDLSRWGVSHVSRMFALAFGLAAPFMIASLVYNLALGVINRAMPQLMVAFVGAPAITFGGLFLLFAGSPLILSIWSDALFAFIQNPFGAAP